MPWLLQPGPHVSWTKIVRRKINSLARRLSLPLAPARPLFAWITPTTRCNLRCITCVRSIDPNWKSMDMDPKVYEVVRRDILPGLMSVELTGTGEPFLAPIFETILDDVLGMNLEYSVTTNLTVLPDDAILERMVRSRGSLMISIDGTRESTLTHVRPGLNYEVFRKNLRSVADLVKSTKNPDFSLRFNFVITNTNVEEMVDLVELANHYGVKSIVFSSFLVGNRTDEYTEESLFDSPEIVKPHLARAVELARHVDIDISLPVFESNPGHASELDEEEIGDPLKPGQCPHPWWSVYVDVDGSIMPCCVFGVPFGNLTEKPFKKIWNGPVYRHFRKIVNTMDMPEGCKQCPLDVRL